jgi:hypothetical protein
MRSKPNDAIFHSPVVSHRLFFQFPRGGGHASVRLAFQKRRLLPILEDRIHDERPREEHEDDEQRDPEREIGPFRAHHRVKVQASSSFHQVRRTHDDDDD